MPLRLLSEWTNIKTRPLLNVKKPPSKRSAHFDTPVKIWESVRELIQESDSDNNASNAFRNIQTLGEPSHCENLSSSA